MEESGRESATAVLLDLNHRSGKALEVIRALKSNPGEGVAPVIGYLSHVQTDLAAAAREAGCDVVLSRSAFVQQLPGLLRKLAESEKGSI
jgi:CheY-like chemotaxis protein